MIRFKINTPLKILSLFLSAQYFYFFQSLMKAFALALLSSFWYSFIADKRQIESKKADSLCFFLMTKAYRNEIPIEIERKR